ncbi:probable Kelch domain-containing protein 10 at N-terminal half [Coccomyxa sp. Obi]|nr:probable Kelch domain-containing protein 10 at N-terminal half [Coccomyxa sp. Obi]
MGRPCICLGGCTLKDGSTSARNSLHKLTPKGGLAYTKGLQWQELPAGGNRPAERFAHGCWMQHGKLYVFGGIQPNSEGSSQPADIWTLTGDTAPRLKTLDDLWQYDMEKRRWIILEPSGLLPAARARMGVASNGSIAYICGGATGYEDSCQKMNLADVWLFAPQTCSWAQVVPCKSQTTWMSARYSHACGMVGNFVCAVGGCVSMSDRISPVEGLCVQLLSHTASLRSPFVIPGIIRDEALEKAAAFMGVFRECKGQPPHIQDLLDASKTGGCILHVQDGDVLDILGSCMMTPRELRQCPLSSPSAFYPAPSATDLAELHPSQLEPKGETVKYKHTSGLVANSGLDNPWGSENNPFHYSPRHLAAPCEVQVHLQAAPSSLSEGILAISSTIKVFGTVKAAVAYWQSTLVVDGRSDFSWKAPDEDLWAVTAQKIEHNLIPALEDMEESVHPLFTRLAGSVGYTHTNSVRNQVYVQTVTDHYYAAHLITHQWSPKEVISPGACALRDMCQFLKIQQIAIAEVAHKWPCVCCHCGKAQVLRGRKHTPKMKVCKGCHMVRYCSVECQNEAWPQHKEHCRLSS